MQIDSAEEILQKKILKKELKIIKLQDELRELKRELEEQHPKQLKANIKIK